MRRARTGFKASAPGGASRSADQMPGAVDPLLRVENLRTWFRTQQGLLRAVDGVSFDLDRGHTLGIVGESGSGKSVLSRTITNLLDANAAVPPGGRIEFDGSDVRKLPRDRARHFWGVEVAMVFQDPMTSLNPVMRIGPQITEALKYHLSLSSDDAERRVVELLGLVGLPEPAMRLKQYPHELSGGMRQRVTIAMALACEPKLLIADEPTTALDVTVQRQILDLLQGLQQKTGMAMMLVTHDLGVVAGRSDEIAVMYAGRVVERAPTRVLFSNMRHPYTEALTESIPRLENPSHTRLRAIRGRPPVMIDAPRGCSFAPRCRYAQPHCLQERPPLEVGSQPGHEHACFFPVGTDRGRDALERNLRAGHTAAGLDLADPEVA